MIVNERFALKDTKPLTKKVKFGGNGLGEFVYRRTYSRPMDDGSNEDWPDTILRTVNGVFSIRKDHYLKNGLPWNENYWQNYATGFADYMHNMYFLPPGRGLWAMGTNFVYERGSAALYNCAFVEVMAQNLAQAADWTMDMLMCGSGVGFGTDSIDGISRTQITIPNDYTQTIVYEVEDSREGWADSVEQLILCYLGKGPNLDIRYHKVRPANVPIKGFGGYASGPAPLKLLHEQIRGYFWQYVHNHGYTWTRLIADIFNSLGCCVVAGNVRRSAEIMVGRITDHTFMNLKNYKLFPERAAIGWMSNNSPKLMESEDFEHLSEIARLVKINGEPGIINGKNMPLGRIGDHSFEYAYDHAVGFNPCGEIPLESFEVCNIGETNPTVCPTPEHWLKAAEYCSFYCSTVSLLPTHRPETNLVVARNRRIGVGITDYCGWVERNSQDKVIGLLRKGYRIVRETNARLNAEAGIPAAIRCTTVKPGGTVPKLPGVNSGMSYPNFRFVLRRVRIARSNPLATMLMVKGVPNEPDVTDPTNTLIFEFPWETTKGKTAEDVTIWEQIMNLITLQTHWSDNAVSNTLFFKPEWEMFKAYDNRNFTVSEEQFHFHVVHNSTGEIIGEYAFDDYKYSLAEEYGQKKIMVFKHNPNHEENDVEHAMSSAVPFIKSLSVLPFSRYGIYPQMPESKLTEEEYHERIKQIGTIDYSELRNYVPDGETEKFCSGETCELPAGI